MIKVQISGGLLTDYYPYTITRLHYAIHDTGLMHGHRKLRLVEDFEVLGLTPDFKPSRLMPARQYNMECCKKGENCV